MEGRFKNIVFSSWLRMSNYKSRKFNPMHKTTKNLKKVYENPKRQQQLNVIVLKCSFYTVLFVFSYLQIVPTI